MKKFAILDLFTLWGKEKQKIHAVKIQNFYVNQREIWFTKMGQNIGFEENGKSSFLRPVLVLKKVGNLFFTVALTSKGKSNNLFYHEIVEGKFNSKNLKYKNSSFAILSQVKVMDKKRFTEKMGIVSQEELENIQKKLKELLL